MRRTRVWGCRPSNSTPFTPVLLQQLLNKTGVFVAEDEGKIVSYLLAGDWKFFSQWEIFKMMLDRLPKLEFQSQDINPENSFQCGPMLYLLVSTQ